MECIIKIEHDIIIIIKMEIKIEIKIEHDVL